MHYRRMLRQGWIGQAKPLRAQRRYVKGTDEERFWDKVKKTDTCWYWMGATTTAGYGEFQIDKRTVYVHRWAYTVFKGKIPETLHIDHLCNTRNCVNPDHMEPVTIQENSRREAERLKYARTN